MIVLVKDKFITWRELVRPITDSLAARLFPEEIQLKALYKGNRQGQRVLCAQVRNRSRYRLENPLLPNTDGYAQ
jgi:hypothetical protein